MKKIKIIVLSILFISSVLLGQAEVSKISSMPGAFSRMGFGARGKGMGNALSAITVGSLASYYNPALMVFQKDNTFQSAYTFLSIDRSLNYISFSKRFKLGRKKKSDDMERFTGVSIGIINAGVSNIEGRTSEGYKTEDLSTSENQFFITLSNRFTKKLSLGVNLKYFHYNLYKDISGTGVGLDIGALYSVTEAIAVSVMISDINSKYSWNTNDIYGQDGNDTVDKFPVRKKIGVSYKLEEPSIVAAVEFENSNADTDIIRLGAEYLIYKGLFLRAGIDNINLSNSDFPARASCGFSYFHSIGNWNVGFDYAFVSEPFSNSNVHVIGLNILF